MTGLLHHTAEVICIFQREKTEFLPTPDISNQKILFPILQQQNLITVAVHPVSIDPDLLAGLGKTLHLGWISNLFSQHQRRQLLLTLLQLPDIIGGKGILLGIKAKIRRLEQLILRQGVGRHQQGQFLQLLHKLLFCHLA